MKKYFVFLVLVVLVVLLGWLSSSRTASEFVSRLQWPVMGTVAGISSRGCEQAAVEKAQPACVATFTRLDGLLSAWNPDSELSRVAGLAETQMLAAVSVEVRPCYAAAFQLMRMSGGAFNPYVGKTLKQLEPDKRAHTSDFDLGAIAKGFAVDVACEALAAAFPKDAKQALLVDLGGNLRAVCGSWTTGVRNPFGKGNAAAFTLRPGEAVATSGNYERFVVVDGVRLSHVLDGRTGKPVSGMASVTVLHPSSAMLADGLSTTLFVLGPAAGSQFLAAHHPEALALWIPDEPDAPRLVATPAMAARLDHPLWGVDVLH